MLIVLLVTLTCLFAAQTVDGVKCFQCSNEQTLSKELCADPFTAKNAVPCEGGMCFKRKSVNGDDQVVTRGCMEDNGAGDKCTTRTILGIETVYCHCVKEGCNGAITLTTTLVVTGLLSTIAVLLASF
ncbi:hypothetical protein LSAT2_027213 [Lamellibrachia satsuma]|nr:hypothetical protein LSAT2_027213 [Lamellibrachia satsuma]